MSIEERESVRSSLVNYRDCVVASCRESGLATREFNKTIENFPVSCMKERISLYSSVADVSSNEELVSSVLSGYDSSAREACVSSFTQGIAEFCQTLKEQIEKKKLANESIFYEEAEYRNKCEK